METRSKASDRQEGDNVITSAPSPVSAVSVDKFEKMCEQISALTNAVAHLTRTAAARSSEETEITQKRPKDPSRQDFTSVATYSRLAAPIEKFPEDPRADLKVIYWSQATARALCASDIPREQQLKLAASYIPTKLLAAKIVDQCESFAHLTATLRKVFTPNSAITSHFLDVIKQEHDNPLDAINAVFNMFSLAEYLEIPNAEIGLFWQRMLVLSVLNDKLLDELERHIDPIDGFCDDEDHVAFRDQIIRKSSQPKSSKTPAATLNAILGDRHGGYACSSAATIAALNAVHALPNSKLAAANSNIIHLRDMLAEAEIHRDELLDAGHAYELNALDANHEGLHDHEVWALNFFSHSPTDLNKLTQAMLKIPKHLRKQMYDKKQCYFCKKSIYGPNGHTWKDCPQAPQ